MSAGFWQVSSVDLENFPHLASEVAESLLMSGKPVARWSETRGGAASLLIAESTDEGSTAWLWTQVGIEWAETYGTIQHDPRNGRATLVAERGDARRGQVLTLDGDLVDVTL